MFKSLMSVLIVAGAACGGKISNGVVLPAAEAVTDAGQDAGNDEAAAVDASYIDVGGDATEVAALTPMSVCDVVSGNVLAVHGKAMGPATLGVASASADTVEVGGENSLGQWLISVSTEKMGRPLAPGLYDAAEHLGAEEQGHPGFDFSASGVSSSCPPSRFRIGAISVISGSLKAFTIDFEYRCEGSPVRGCFHFDPTQN